MQNYDIAIIGMGPAGMQAGIHASRRKLKVVIFGKIENSALYKAKVENFAGFYPIILGEKILKTSKAQVKDFGAELIEEDIVFAEKQEDNTFILKTETGNIVNAKAVIIATGILRKKLKVKGEEEYLGKGVSYCAECDAMFFKNKIVTVVGEGSAAVGAAIFLTKFAKKVILIAKKIKVSSKFKKELDESLVEVKEGVWINEITGNGKIVTGIIDDKANKIQTDGVFIELGSKSAVEIFADLGVEAHCTDAGCFSIRLDQSTNVAGVFAAGDVTGQPWQAPKAVGEGCKAGISAADYVKQSIS